MHSTFQTTFQHLVAANNLLHDGSTPSDDSAPTPPPLPVTATPNSSTANPTPSTDIMIIRGIYCAVTGPLPTSTLSRLPTETALKKTAQRARRQNNPQPRAPSSLAELILRSEHCKTLRGADMLLYDNGGHERRVIILATFKLSPTARAGIWMEPSSLRQSCSTSYLSSRRS